MLSNEIISLDMKIHNAYKCFHYEEETGFIFINSYLDRRLI